MSTQVYNLIINKLDSQETYDYMEANGLFNENEVYIVEGKNTSIRYTAQELTEEEKTQARQNIGITPDNIKAAPVFHASSNTTYGQATSSNYGHVKLSDSTTSDSTASDGVAASPAAVKAAYDHADSKAPKYSYGTTDLVAGSSALETGKLYFVYEE